MAVGIERDEGGGIGPGERPSQGRGWILLPAFSVAIELALFSEIGNVYRPRWPKLVVKRKPGAKNEREGEESGEA